MPASDNFSPDDMDVDGAMDMDFSPEEVAEPAKLMKASSKRKHPIDIYSVFLIISAFFYLIALAATLAELAPYCKNFMWLS